VTARCPTCKKSVARDDADARWPFCFDRCRLVDLGRWLGEEYRVPDESASIPEEDRKPAAWFAVRSAP
jgi:endogenous inhibitor of DNA gyrase (YacG/DUF329 family)